MQLFLHISFVIKHRIAYMCTYSIHKLMILTIWLKNPTEDSESENQPEKCTPA